MILAPHDPTWFAEFAALREVYTAALRDLDPDISTIPQKDT